MSSEQHGLSIEVASQESIYFLNMKAVGKLTHEDYEAVTPVMDAALVEVKSEKVHVFLDVTEMRGWEIRAAWDDFKIGLKHGRKFGKIALYGSKSWQGMAAKVGSWFVSGEIKYFEDSEKALTWLNE